MSSISSQDSSLKELKDTVKSTKATFQTNTLTTVSLPQVELLRQGAVFLIMGGQIQMGM